jgi:pyruvate,orthophosphate dikinase
VRITLPMVGLGIDPSREGAEVAELAAFRPRIEELKRQVEEETGATLSYELGAMIETPAAALNADLVAQHADYFSYGTNDLTQLTLGVDRENTTLLASYREAGLLSESPFKRIDPTVAKLVEVSLSTGRAVKRELSGGVCGEQAADPESLSRLSRAGVSYVSVSPYRVPTALVVSAQDKIRAELAVDAAIQK